MAYTQLLNSIIEQSGLTVKEISERCVKMGVDVTPAYISTLRNDKNNRTPSDKVSRALAEACNCEHKNILVVEAYLQNAPQEFNGLMEMLRGFIITSGMSMIENRLTTQDVKEVDEMLKSFPMAELICDMSKEQVMNSIKKGYGSLNIKASKQFEDIKIKQEVIPIGLPITDNGMSPLIKSNDLVTIEALDFEEYKTGDVICCFKNGEKKKIIARKIVVDKTKQITLLPINNEYNPEIVSLDDIVIMGKVKKVISTIQ